MFCVLAFLFTLRMFLARLLPSSFSLFFPPFPIVFCPSSPTFSSFFPSWSRFSQGTQRSIANPIHSHESASFSPSFEVLTEFPSKVQNPDSEAPPCLFLSPSSSSSCVQQPGCYLCRRGREASLAPVDLYSLILSCHS